MLIKVIKRKELGKWIAFKKEAEFDGPAQYQYGYIDALDNLWQDISEGRLPTYLFEGDESEGILL